ncbi:MAG: galactokinase, partial [Clostridia bacterium]|nr:galactokinase [Clostridia bacterium]
AKIRSREGVERLSQLYSGRDGALARQISRYSGVVKKHEEVFHSQGCLDLISAPGRIEIIGNHTDHNNGRVLAAAVDLDTLCAISPRADLTVRIVSEGFPALELSLDSLEPRADEQGKSAALVRGVARGMADRGFTIGGFDAVMVSDVASGSGLSSSAAYEVLIAKALDHLYNSDRMHSTERAQIAQYAENVFFGKPSGLMDQMACSTGGLVYIDFKDEPQVEALSYRFGEHGYDIVVVNTRSSHDDLTDAYAAIRREMNEVAAFFGKKVLREVRPEEVWKNLAALRQQLGERPVLRAAHFFEENQRVKKLVRDVRAEDTANILSAILASGDSSQKLLQNVFVPGVSQPVSQALMVASHFLQGKGAWRVHGGGFAGTTLNIVPSGMTAEFVEEMNGIFGKDSCYVLDVRRDGPSVVLSIQK